MSETAVLVIQLIELPLKASQQWTAPTAFELPATTGTSDVTYSTSSTKSTVPKESLRRNSMESKLPQHWSWWGHIGLGNGYIMLLYGESEDIEEGWLSKFGSNLYLTSHWGSNLGAGIVSRELLSSPERIMKITKSQVKYRLLDSKMFSVSLKFKSVSYTV